jgi:ABC-2 type transport system ATP-binding protein
MTIQPILTVNNIHKKIGNKVILEDINLVIDPGEIVGLLGPNGSGKTTLIKIIVGLMKKNEGTVFINGYSLDQELEEALRFAGAIIENPEFYLNMTGYENLQQYAEMAGGISAKKLKEIVDRVGLSHAIHNKVKEYSLGMRQRLGIAQGILHSPGLLILDEPTNGLDPGGMRDFRELIKELAKRDHVAIMIASHLLSEVEELCDRVIIIQNGKIKSTVVLQETFHEEFLIHMEIAPKEKAMKWLKQQNYEAEEKGNFISVKVRKEQIPILCRNLSNEGIDIFSVIPVKPSLEESFMSWTNAEMKGEEYVQADSE